MIKVGPPCTPKGTGWDHKEKTEIAQIFISCSRSLINYMYFVYVEDGGNKLVFSEKIGVEETSHSVETVTFDYPSEYITRVSGKYTVEDTSYTHAESGKYIRETKTLLCSITFCTNKGTYGPFVPAGEPTRYNAIDFNYQVGGKFCGFFGSYHKDSIESIGFYVKPLEKQANQPGEMVSIESGIAMGRRSPVPAMRQPRKNLKFLDA